MNLLSFILGTMAGGFSELLLCVYSQSAVRNLGERNVSKMNLARYEQETIICYNEEEATASIYTHNTKLMEKLKRLSEKYPNKVRLESHEHHGAVSYIVPKRCVSVREPYSDERREAASIRAKTAMIHPPNRSIRSKNK